MRKIFAANWKMNKSYCEATSFAKEFLPFCSQENKSEVIIFPAFTSIYAVYEELKNTKIGLGVQNFYPAPNGAYTCEMSLSMFQDLNINWTLIGHSERRHVINESYEFIESKLNYSLANNYSSILCIGEKLEEHDNLADVLNTQLWQAIKNIDSQNLDPEKFVIAYEPVWAIGTGKVASSEDIIQAHSIVRATLSKYLGSLAAKIRILYGGSVNPKNAKEIISLDNVNGLLVGGASLDVQSFSAIVDAGN